jgi:phospholipid/cholesterol/gamma-HCH transport system substrate-binding protein
MKRERIARLATTGVAIAVVVIVALVLFTGGSSYIVNAQFADAGQLVGGDLVTVAGHKVGSVGAITITPNGLANVQLKISDKSLEPLSSNTTATIGQLSLTGITNRFVSVAPGVGGSHIDNNGTLGVTHTKGIVDLDSVLDAFTPQVRKSLQEFFKTGAYFVRQPTASQLNTFSSYLNPALSQVSNLGAEIVSDKYALDRLIGSTAKLTAPLAAETNQIQGSVDNTSTLFTEIAAQRSALQDSIKRAPAVLRQVTSTFGRVDTTLVDLDPTLTALRPVAPKLARLLRVVVPFAQNLEPTATDFQTLLNQANTALTTFVPAAKTAEPAFTALTGALKGVTPILSALRPYVPDFVAGFFNGVGGSTGAAYDANGHYLQVRLAVSGSSGSLDGIASLLGESLSSLGTGSGGVFTNTKPCPGGGTIPSNDGSAPWNNPDSAASLGALCVPADDQPQS